MKREISQHAAAAKAIRQALKKQGIKCSVTSESFSMGSAVRVKILADIMPATRRAIEAFADQYQYGHFDGMNDIYEYSNRRDDLPQAKYVTVDVEYSNDIWMEAKAYAIVNRDEFGFIPGDVGAPWQVLNGSRGNFWRDRKPRQRVAAVMAEHVDTPEPVEDQPETVDPVELPAVDWRALAAKVAGVKLGRDQALYIVRQVDAKH